MFTPDPTLYRAHRLALNGIPDEPDALIATLDGLGPAQQIYADYLVMRLTDADTAAVMRELHHRAVAAGAQALAALILGHLASLEEDLPTLRNVYQQLCATDLEYWSAEVALALLHLDPDRAQYIEIWERFQSGSAPFIAAHAATSLGHSFEVEPRTQMPDAIQVAITWFERAYGVATAPIHRFFVLRGWVRNEFARGNTARARELLDSMTLDGLPPWCWAATAGVYAMIGAIEVAREYLVRAGPPNDTVERVAHALVAFYAGAPLDPALLTTQTTGTPDPNWVSLRGMLRHLAGLETDFRELENLATSCALGANSLAILRAILGRRSDPWDARSMRLRRLIYLQTADTDLLVGVPHETRIPLNSYDLHLQLGQGAMGQVLLGRHTWTGHPVAIKLLHQPTPHAEVEALLAARLDHPNIARILDIGRLDAFAAACDPATLQQGAHFVVMELVEGQTLEDDVGRLEWSILRPLLLDALDALAHAHARGVLHLDLKPGNMMRADGCLRLVDFGVAAMLSTLPGNRRIVAGTPYFMSPEQWSGKLERLGPWSDLYGLGATAWMLITGRPLFDLEDHQDLMRAHSTAPRPPLNGDRDLEHWLHTLLAIDPSQRFASAAEAAEALRQIDTPTQRYGTEPLSDEHVPTELRTSFIAGLPQVDLPPSSIMPRGQPAQLDEHWQRLTRADGLHTATRIARLRLSGGELEGHHALHDALWRALGRVHRSGRSHRIALHLRPGVRAEPLLHWFILRARESGIPAHVLDTRAPAWEDQLWRDVIGRTALGNVEPRPWARTRMGRSSTPPVLEALGADLGTGTSLLVVRGRVDGPLLEQQMKHPCLVLRVGRHRDVDQILVMERVDDDAVVNSVQRRIDLEPTSLGQVVRAASGCPGRAIGELERLIDEDALSVDRSLWRIAADHHQQEFPTHPARLLAALLGDLARDEQIALATAALRGIPLPGRIPDDVEEDLQFLGLLDDDRRLQVEACLPLLELPGVDGIEPSELLDPIRVHWLARHGEYEEAIALLCENADRRMREGRRARAVLLLESASRLALDAGVPMPGRYWFVRARVRHSSDPVAAIQDYRRAAEDPRIRRSALTGMALLQAPGEAEATLRGLLDDDPADMVRMRLAVHLARSDRADEGLALLEGRTQPFARYTLLALVRPRERDREWVRRVESLADDISHVPALLAIAEASWAGPSDRLPDYDVPPYLDAIIGLVYAVRREDEDGVREKMAKVKAQNQVAARLWLDVTAPESIWRESLAAALPGQKLVSEEAWILEQAIRRTADPERKAALRDLIARPPTRGWPR